MHLLMIILNEQSRLEDVVTAMVEAGVQGATIVESYGMGKVLSRDIPIFAGFRHITAGAQPYNFTIISQIESDAVLDELVALLKDVLKPGKSEIAPALLISVPAERFIRFDADGEVHDTRATDGFPPN